MSYGIDGATVNTGQLTVYPSGSDMGEPWYPWPGFNNGTAYWWPNYVTQPPVDCSGDVHVFPCPHCDKCKCGGATKAKKAATR